MKIRSCVDQARRLAILEHIGEDQDIGIVRMVESVDHMGLGPPPATGKCHHVQRRQALRRQHNEAMRVQGMFKLRKHLIPQGFAQVHARDARTQYR